MLLNSQGKGGGGRVLCTLFKDNWDFEIALTIRHIVVEAEIMALQKTFVNEVMHTFFT